MHCFYLRYSPLISTVTLKPGYELQVAVPTKSESTARRVVSGWVGSVNDFGAGRVNRNGSDILELLSRKFTKTQ